MDFFENDIILKDFFIKMEKILKDGLYLKIEKKFKDGFFKRWKFFNI